MGTTKGFRVTGQKQLAPSSPDSVEVLIDVRWPSLAVGVERVGFAARELLVAAIAQAYAELEGRA